MTDTPTRWVWLKKPVGRLGLSELSEIGKKYSEDEIRLLEEIERRGPLSFYMVCKLFGELRGKKVWYKSRAHYLTDYFHNFLPTNYRTKMKYRLKKRGYNLSRHNYRLEITDKGLAVLERHKRKKNAQF